MDNLSVVYIHNEIFSAIKKGEYVLFAGKWMELKIIILSDFTVLQRQVITYFLSFVEARGKKRDQLGGRRGRENWDGDTKM
jgi:hypothetical protein